MKQTNNPFPLSHSRIAAFDCPWYAFNNYYESICKWLGVDPDPDGPKPAPVGINTECGRFGHELIQGYTKHLMDQNLQSDPQLMKDITQNNDLSLPESEYDDMESALIRFAESHLFTPKDIYGVEMRLAFRTDKPKCTPPRNAHKLNKEQTKQMKDFMLFIMGYDLSQCEWTDPAVWFRGIIDLCEMPDPEIVIITDYKFGWAAQSRSDLRRSLQGRIYCWLMSLVNPAIKNFFVRFDFVRKGIMVELEYTPDEVQQTAERVGRIGRKIENQITEFKTDANNWPARVCNNCQWCLYDCKLEGKRHQIQKAVGDRAEAVQIAADILELDVVRKRKNDLMKAYLKDEKPVDVGGQRFAYHVTEKKSYDPSDAYFLLVANNFDDPFQVMSIDTAKLNAKKRADIKKTLAPMAQVKTSQRYGIKKVGDETINEN